MKKPFFAGMIGGRPKQGLYFYGNINGRFAYLDPHIVQSVYYEDESEYLKTFNCEDRLLL
jgi:cysteine protease ATG4